MKRYIFPEPLEGASCTLQPDSMTSPITGSKDIHPDNGAVCISFDVPSTVPNRNGGWLRISWLKELHLVPFELHGIIDTLTVGGGRMEFDIFKGQKASGGVRPFVLDGHFCRYADDGTEMLINETTGFRLFARYRAGEAKADQFAQSCADNSINMVRVSGMQDTTLYLQDPALRYRIYPDDATYYRDLDTFIDWCAGYGLNLDFVCCMQAQTLMQSSSAEIRHIQQVFEIFHHRSNFVSKVNEQGIYDNSITVDALNLSKPAGAAFLLSTGSRESGAEDATMPLGDLVELHLNDSNEWWRKGHNAWEMGQRYDRAGYVSETTRTDKDGNLNHFEDDAKTQTAMTLAALIHTPEGKNADPFDFSLGHIAAHNKGIAAVPLSCRRGAYGRQDCAALRCYSMSDYRWAVRR